MRILNTYPNAGDPSRLAKLALSLYSPLVHYSRSEDKMNIGWIQCILISHLKSAFNSHNYCCERNVLFPPFITEY